MCRILHVVFTVYAFVLSATFGAESVYSQSLDDPWNSADVAAYIYTSPTGSDKSNGRTPQNTIVGGPKRTLQGAIDELAARVTLPSKTVIVMGKGRYDLTAPIQVPVGITDRTALKIRSEEGEVAVITGARTYYGSWKEVPGSIGVVQSDVSTFLGTDYHRFSTLYSHQGRILPKARFPTYDTTSNSYFLTKGVPFLEYLRLTFELSTQQLESLTQSQSTASLEEVLAHCYRNFKGGVNKEIVTLRKEAALASGYTVEELARGLVRLNLAGTAMITVKITLGDAVRQTFLIDEADARAISKFDYTRADLVVLPTFEVTRTKLLRILPFQFGSTLRRIGVTSVPVRREFSGWLSQVGYRFYFENDRMMVTTPGTWFLDRSTKMLYYKLLPSQGIRTDGKIYESGSLEPLYFNIPSAVFKSAPLLTIGTRASPARSAILEGLRFSYTDWEFPGIGYYSGGQSYSQSSPSTGPALLFPSVYAECTGCTFVSNTFSGIAGHALSINGALTTVTRNEVHNIGANGITFGFPAEEASPRGSLNGELSNHHNKITQNRLASIGEIHEEGTGILAYRASDLEISDNTVEDVSYTGISLGWGWHGSAADIKRVIDKNVLMIEQADRNAPAAFFEGALSGRNNSIQRNLIRRAMRKLIDGAGIYVVGSQPGTKLIGNVVYDISRRDQLLDILYGIYLDRGTHFVEVRDNVVGRIGRAAVMLNTTSRVKIVHNIFLELINERGQGGFVSDNTSYSMGGWATEYLNQVCASTPSCTPASPSSKNIEMVAHDNLLVNNIYIGGAKSPFVVKAQSLSGVQETSLKSGGAHLMANQHIDWNVRAPYSSVQVAQQLKESPGLPGVIISTSDSGVRYNSSDSSVSIQSTSPALKPPVSFGSFSIRPGVKVPVGAYHR